MAKRKITISKDDFLIFADAYGACETGKEYIRNHTSDDAEEIYNTCETLSHLAWIARRMSLNAIEHGAPLAAVRQAQKLLERAEDKAWNTYPRHHGYADSELTRVQTRAFRKVLPFAKLVSIAIGELKL